MRATTALSLLAALCTAVTAVPNASPAGYGVQARAPAPSKRAAAARSFPSKRAPVEPRAPHPQPSKRAPHPQPSKRAPQPSKRATPDSPAHPQPSKRAPTPAPAPSKRLLKRSDAAEVPFDAVSRALCPAALSVCPVVASTGAEAGELQELLKHGFECVDFRSDLESCGGCGIVDEAHNCMAIPNASAVSCVVGRCEVNNCEVGYKVGADGASCVRA